MYFHASPPLPPSAVLIEKVALAVCLWRERTVDTRSLWGITRFKKEWGSELEALLGPVLLWRPHLSPKMEP